MLKRILIAALFAPLLALAQSYPSPTFNNLNVNGTFTATGKVGLANLAAQAANTVVTNATASSASPTAVAVPSCSAATNALQWTSGSGFACNTAVNAATLNGATFAAPSAIGSTTPAAGTFTTATANSYSQNIGITGTNLAGNCSLTVPSTNYCANYFTLGGTAPYDTATLNDPAAFLNGLAIVHTYGGGFTGGRQTLVVESTLAGASGASQGNRNYVGAIFQAQAASGDGGTGLTSGTAKGGIFAINPIAVSYSGATNLLELTGAEFNMSAQTGSSMYYKAGMTVVQGPTDQVQGTVYDTAIGLSNQGGQVGWQNGILFGPMNGAFPITATGCLICSTGAGTATTGLDFSSLTLSGNFLAGPNGFNVNGNGSLNAKSGTFANTLSASYSNPTIVSNDTSSTNNSNFTLQKNGTPVWSLTNASSTGLLNLVRYVGGVNTDSPITVSNSTGVVSFVDGIAGVTSGANASAGNVGEILTNSASGVSLTSGTTANVTSKLLTAGDWDVQCSFEVLVGTGGASIIQSAVSTTSATLGSLGQNTILATSFTASQNQWISSPVWQVNSSGSTTVYCPINVTFPSGTVTASASIRARRIH